MEVYSWENHLQPSHFPLPRYSFVELSFGIGFRNWASPQRHGIMALVYAKHLEELQPFHQVVDIASQRLPQGT